MLLKILLILCSSVLSNAGIIETDYSPATAVSYSSISTPAIVNMNNSPFSDKTIDTSIGYTKIIQSPPVYESVVTTKESKYKTPDGTQHSTFSKTFDTGYLTSKKFESKFDNGIISNTIPDFYSSSGYSPIVYNPHTAYTYSSPLTHTVSTSAFSKPISVPVHYATHNIPVTKTLVAPDITSYTSPVTSKTKIITSDLPSYSSPLVHTVSSPIYTKSVSFSNHNVPTITSYTSPVLLKSKVITSGLSSYSLHTPIIEAQPIKSTLTYSEAPLVSHMSFSGLGTIYTW